MTNLNIELNLTNSFSRNSRLYLIILGFIICILASTPTSSAAVTNTSSNSSYHIYYLDKSVGGNVQANSEIRNNIPKTSLSSQIFNMTKNGSVVVKFGNGKGPKLLISTGVHGNEEEANIAVIKYLEYIKNKKFNGTLHIIPFDIPRDTALNSRLYKGKDPNRIANIKGTPGYNIIKFAKNNGIKYILDVHSGSGVPSGGWIYVNSPSTLTITEKKWFSYIKSHSQCSVSTNSANSPGMIRCFARINGINCITLEVERDSIPTTSAASMEYKLIVAAVKYLGFPGYSSTKPYIFTTRPTINATGVALTSPVTITFSEKIQKGTTFSGICIKNLSNGKRVSMASITVNGNILTIKQLYKWLNNNLYKVYIPARAIKDVNGNYLKTSYIYRFKTI